MQSVAPGNFCIETSLMGIISHVRCFFLQKISTMTLRSILYDLRYYLRPIVYVICDRIWVASNKGKDAAKFRIDDFRALTHRCSPTRAVKKGRSNFKEHIPSDIIHALVSRTRYVGAQRCGCTLGDSRTVTRSALSPKDQYRGDRARLRKFTRIAFTGDTHTGLSRPEPSTFRGI